MQLLIKFYTDENISKALAVALRNKGIDVLTCQEAGLRSASDEEHFKFVQENQLAIITNDNDFLKLAARQTEHWGIVFIVSQRTDIGTIVKRITQLHALINAEEFKNQVEYI